MCGKDFAQGIIELNKVEKDQNWDDDAAQCDQVGRNPPWQPVD